MASEKAYFFDAVAENGKWDRAYTSADMAQLFDAMFTDGIVPAYEQGLVVSAGTTGLKPTVTIAPGAAVIDGRIFVIEDASGTGITKELAALPGSAPRIDRVVIELDVPHRSLTAKVLEGTPSSNPVPPSVSREKDLCQLVLADLLVQPGATTVASVTDQRADLSLCGWCGVRLKNADLSAITQAWYNSLKNVYDPGAPVSGSNETSGQIVLRLIAAVESLGADFSTVQSTVSQVESTQQQQQQQITSVQETATTAATATNPNVYLWKATGDNLKNGTWFTKQSLIPHAEANKYDTIEIIFRKSVNCYPSDQKLSGTKYAYALGHAATNPTSVWIKKNADYANELSVTLRKGSSAIVTYIAPNSAGCNGKKSTREVRWLTEEYAEIASGGKKSSGTPTIRFGTSTSLNGSSEKIVRRYQNAIFFGNVVHDGDGNKRDIQGSYSTGYTEMPNNIAFNNDRNQLLIPIAIIGHRVQG